MSPATRTKTREIIFTEGGSSFLRKLTKAQEKYDFEALATMRKILSNEKMRLLHTIKTKQPSSIYALARMLGRDFKSVAEDINFLDKFGFIDRISEKTGKRERLKPVLIIDTLNIKLQI